MMTSNQLFVPPRRLRPRDGLGYLCFMSGQNGQIYPGESWVRPCLITSFFLLKPLPPSALGQTLTGQ
jgi:hypothetical protein